MSEPAFDVAASVSPIIAIVVQMLDDDGYDSVQLREVARRARVSMNTIYKNYPTRDDLICVALESWMGAHRYAGMPAAESSSTVSIHEGLMRVLRRIFEPWEQHPEMLRSYTRARSGPNGHRLIQRGYDAVVPATQAILSRCDPVFVDDVEATLLAVVYGLFSQFADGAIRVTDIVPILDRAVYRLAVGQDGQQADSGVVNADEQFRVLRNR